VPACIGNINSRMQSNQLQLNMSQTEVLWCTLARRQHQIPDDSLMVDLDTAQPVKSVNIYLDSDMSMRTHVTWIVSSWCAAATICIDCNFGCSQSFALNNWQPHFSCCCHSSMKQPSTAGEVITVADNLSVTFEDWTAKCLLGHTDLTSNDLFCFFLAYYRHCICLCLFCKCPRSTFILTLQYKLMFIIIIIIIIITITIIIIVNKMSMWWWGMVAEWWACRFLKLQVAGSNPDGANFRRIITFIHLHLLSQTKTFILSGSIN